MSVTMRIFYKLKLKKDGKIIKNSFKNDSLFCFMADLESNGQIEDEEKEIWFSQINGPFKTRWENKDVIAFKKYLSISGKLKILGHSRIDWAYHGDIVLQFFPEIMSDNPLIHQFLINNLNDICLEDKPDYHKG